MSNTINLNDITKWSKWPGRIMGFEDWVAPKRTREKVREEYDGKYHQCLQYFLSEPTLDLDVFPEAIRAFEFGQKGDAKTCISRGDKLKETTSAKARENFHDALYCALSYAPSAATIVELGCGYGYHLWRLARQFPEINFIGGDCSPNAIQLAKLLYQDPTNIDVVPFDFYDDDYELLRGLPEPITVFTCHAIEQIPDATHIIQQLAKLPKGTHVIHFEPVYGLHGESLLGLMRQCYAEMNDYNRNLLTVLESTAGVEIVSKRPNVIGLNPLNPTSIIHWMVS